MHSDVGNSGKQLQAAYRLEGMNGFLNMSKRSGAESESLAPLWQLQQLLRFCKRRNS